VTGAGLDELDHRRPDHRRLPSSITYRRLDGRRRPGGAHARDIVDLLDILEFRPERRGRRSG
jgi:hypothetical protein